MKLSKSKVNSFLKCRREFKYNYIDGIEMPANEYMALGTLVHEYAENMALFLINKQSENNKIEKEDIEEAKLLILESNDIDKDDIIKYLDNLESFFCRCLLEYKYSIFSIEEYIHDTNINLSGLADIVFEDNDGNLIVVDYKTSKTQSIKKYRLELCYYKKLLEFQYPNRKVITAGIFFVKDNGYRFLNFTNGQLKGSFITNEDYEAAIDLLDYIRTEVEKGVFLPSRQYTCKYCCYKELCEKDGNF